MLHKLMTASCSMAMLFLFLLIFLLLHLLWLLLLLLMVMMVLNWSIMVMVMMVLRVVHWTTQCWVELVDSHSWDAAVCSIAVLVHAPFKAESFL